MRGPWHQLLRSGRATWAARGTANRIGRLLARPGLRRIIRVHYSRSTYRCQPCRAAVTRALPRAPEVPTSPTATALLDAAERLFAQAGLAAVSIRRIVLASGQGNLSAAHYHFGSRDALVRAVIERRLREIDAIRNRRLDALEAKLLAAHCQQAPEYYNDNLRYKSQFQQLLREAATAREQVRDSTSFLSRSLAQQQQQAQASVQDGSNLSVCAPPPVPAHRVSGSTSEVSALHSKFTQDPNF